MAPRSIGASVAGLGREGLTAVVHVMEASCDGEAASSGRALLRSANERLRISAWSIAQASLAAGTAHLLAVEVLGHPRPFFAPITALVALSIRFDERVRRAGQAVAGVAVGLGIAAPLVAWLGAGSAQLAAGVLASMTAAVWFGGGFVMVNQAAIAALLVVVLGPIGGFATDRLLDAVVGGAVALGVHYALPPHIARAPARALRWVSARRDAAS